MHTTVKRYCGQSTGPQICPYGIGVQGIESPEGPCGRFLPPPLPFETPFVYGDPMSAGDLGVPPDDEAPSTAPAASARCLGLNVSFSRFKDAIGNLDLRESVRPSDLENQV